MLREGWVLAPSCGPRALRDRKCGVWREALTSIRLVAWRCTRRRPSAAGSSTSDCTWIGWAPAVSFDGRRRACSGFCGDAQPMLARPLLHLHLSSMFS
eukprot:242817-Chlamydomonas_euryale.AAC.2